MVSSALEQYASQPQQFGTTAMPSRNTLLAGAMPTQGTQVTTGLVTPPVQFADVPRGTVGPGTTAPSLAQMQADTRLRSTQAIPGAPMYDQQALANASPQERAAQFFTQLANVRQNNPAASAEIARLQAGGATPQDTLQAMRNFQTGVGQVTPEQPFGPETGQPLRTTNNTVGPSYGLSGAEDAIRTGLGSSLAALDTGVTQGAEALQGGFAEGSEALTAGEQRGQRNLERIMGRERQNLAPYQQAGQMATGTTAALTGLLGPEAQQQAYENFQSSPGYQFARDEAMRAVMQNAAATGGAGGGNVLRALQDRAADLASQEYGNYYNRLAGQSGQGLQAGGIGAGLTGQQAGLGTGLTQMATTGLNQNAGNLGRALAGLYGTGGTQAANILNTGGTNLANMRYGTGRDMAQLTSGTTQNMGQMTDALGRNLANLMSGIGTNMSNLQTGGAMANAGQLTNLATLLANLSQGQGTGQANIDAALGRSNAAGQLGGAAGLRTGLTDLAGLGMMAYPGVQGLISGGGSPWNMGNWMQNTSDPYNIGWGAM